MESKNIQKEDEIKRLMAALMEPEIKGTDQEKKIMADLNSIMGTKEGESMEAFADRQEEELSKMPEFSIDLDYERDIAPDALVEHQSKGKKGGKGAKGKGKGGKSKIAEIHGEDTEGDAEVEALLKKNFGATTKPICYRRRWHQYTKYTFDSGLHVKAERVSNVKINAQKQKDAADRMMKFVEFIAANNFDCGSFVAPGRATSKNYQVLVQKPPRGNYIGDMVREIWLYKNFCVGLGACIRNFHDASKLFTQAHPEIAKQFDEDDIKLPGVKKDASNHGLTHGHIWNLNLMYCAEENKVKIAALDMTCLHNSWFMMDIANCFHAASEQQQLNEGGGKFYDWFSEGYTRGEFTLDRELIHTCCNISRDREAATYYCASGRAIKAGYEYYRICGLEEPAQSKKNAVQNNQAALDKILAKHQKD